MRIGALIVAAGLAASFAHLAEAQTDAPPAAETANQPQILSQAELDQLVAPIALYPDPLLAQVLMAATYPLEIVQADRFAKANKSLKGDALDEALAKQDWDASVKALVATPTVLTTMSEQLDWTENLGDAVLAQQADVMDAIQRLRVKAEDNGKLKTTTEQTVTTTQDAGKETIVIQPANPETVYVPYYEPSVVYGTWDYPTYPPYYFAPAPGWVVGGALASGIAWGAGWAIGNAVWDNFDWHNGNINVDINKNINIDRHLSKNDINIGKWEHNSYHRRGVNYRNDQVRNKYAKGDIRQADRKLDYRGHGGNQVVKPGTRPGDDKRPNFGDKGAGGDKRPDFGKGPGGDKRPDLGKGPGSGGDKRPDLGKQAGIDHKGADLGKAKDRAKPKTNAFDPSDGAKARDFSKRGKASMGNRGPHDFAGPKGGGGPKLGKGGGGPKVGRGGGPKMGGGGRGRGGGGGRGGGRRR